MNARQAVRLQKQGYKITVQAAWHKACPEVTYSPRDLSTRDNLPWVTASGHRYKTSQLNAWG